MPKHFTAEQFAASEAVGELRTQKSFVPPAMEPHRTVRRGAA